MTKRERHLIATLQGVTPAEFRDEKPLEYSDWDVKALLADMSKEQLRNLMNGGPHSEVFRTTVNSSLLRLHEAEEAARTKAKK